MKRLSIIFFFALLLTANACKQRMVCAAFQSSYILDEEKQKQQFSFFQGDSLVLTASTDPYKKNIYGLSERKYGYWKNQDLLKVKQEDQYSSEIDSLMNKKLDPAVQDSLKRVYAEDLNDSTRQEGEDAWSNTKRFHYNVDFVNYMMLVGNDVLKAQSAQRDSAQAKKQQSESEAIESDSTKTEKKGFFKGLFQKKNKDSIKAEFSEEEQSSSEDDQSEQEAEESADKN